MKPPSLIVYLLSLPPRPPSAGGLPRKLVQMDAQQFIANYFPAATVSELTLAPPAGSYAALGYYIVPSPDVEPNVFSIEVFQFGARVVTGIIDGRIIEDGVQGYLPITATYPLRFRLTNRSALPKFWANTVWYLWVETSDDLDFIYEVCKRGVYSSEIADGLAALQLTLEAMRLGVPLSTVDAAVQAERAQAQPPVLATLGSIYRQLPR